MPTNFGERFEARERSFSIAASIEGDAEEHHYDGCFEGSEKKMEIDFIPIDGSDVELLPATGGLRTYDRQYWSEVIALLNGSILLHNPEEKFDAYLISESSLFVYNDRIVILTCGTTLLLRTLGAFIDAAAAIGLEVSWFQYSRKNFLFPDKQHSPHKSFDMEVQYLHRIFPTGRPFVMGPMSSDHWYLFVADFIDREDVRKGKGAVDCEQDERKVLDKDQMLNVYMYGIDPLVAQLFVKGDALILPSIFTNTNTSNNGGSSSSSSRTCSLCGSPRECSNALRHDASIKVDKDKNHDANAAAFEGFNFCSSADEATERSGIGALLGNDGSVAHAHLFEPCGYSMNGEAANGSAYWTIHITPEASCSYASFETNYKCKSYHELIQRVIAVFRPAKFTTVEHVDQDSQMYTAGPVTAAAVDGYKPTGRTLTEGGCTDDVVQMCNYESRTIQYVPPVPPMKLLDPVSSAR